VSERGREGERESEERMKQPTTKNRQEEAKITYIAQQVQPNVRHH
jgi:hypothetical protein